MTKNYKLIISYDGTRYYGWEHQPSTDLTIQGKIERVLARMLDLPEGRIPDVISAGRTDAGVHAHAHADAYTHAGVHAHAHADAYTHADSHNRVCYAVCTDAHAYGGARRRRTHTYAHARWKHAYGRARRRWFPADPGRR